MTHPSRQNLLPESLAYQYALGQWQDFQEVAKTMRLDKLLRRPGEFGRPVYIEALNLLPPAERRAVAFGELAQYANELLPRDFAHIREQLFPNATPFELSSLEALQKGSLPLPQKLPVTIEEFPSRIWQRAMASGSPKRLITAGCQAIDSTLRLLSQIDYMPQENDASDNEVVWRIDIGDIPEIFDLIALSPREHFGLKARLIEALMAKVEANQSTMFKEVFETVPAWVLLAEKDTEGRIEQLIKNTRDLVTNLNNSDRDRLKTRYRLRKLGRLLFRLGHRKESLLAARALRLSAWSEGWQFQPVGGATHAAIRKQLALPQSDANAWQQEPALACSAMSLPLWLADGVSRVSELTELFNQAGAFPWIYPRLHHVFQWHLAIAGKQNALKEVAEICPENQVGLADE